MRKIYFAFLHVEEKRFLENFERCIQNEVNSDQSVKDLFSYLGQFKNQITTFFSPEKDKEKYYRLLANNFNSWDCLTKNQSENKDYLPKQFRELAYLVNLHYRFQKSDIQSKYDTYDFSNLTGVFQRRYIDEKKRNNATLLYLKRFAK